MERLWTETRQRRDWDDEAVNITCVSEDEVRTLNRNYRLKDAPTNVLTFSYPAAVAGQRGEHDIALCLPVAEREAKERGIALRDYVALLLVHAFLHATGLDHEQSPEAEAQMTQAEQEILSASGFAPINL